MPRISIILPVYNEAGCIRDVVEEILNTTSSLDAEIVLVDDGSTDQTPAILAELNTRDRVHVYTQPENKGQSFAFHRGFQEAKGELLITMDADGQNDPADIPRILGELTDGVDAVFGIRRKRRDSWSKRWGSKLANRVRNAALGEDIVDTGCALKGFRKTLLEDLTPWDGMHRFFGSLFDMRGAIIRQVDVNHRPRLAGESKYTNLGRLPKTIRDLWKVRRMKRDKTTTP